MGEFPGLKLEQLAEESSGSSETWNESVSEDEELAIKSNMDLGDEPPPPPASVMTRSLNVTGIRTSG
jgi:hypothetical protein